MYYSLFTNIHNIWILIIIVLTSFASIQIAHAQNKLNEPNTEDGIPKIGTSFIVDYTLVFNIPFPIHITLEPGNNDDPYGK